MNELQWRGMRGVGSGTSRLEVEAAWVGGSCPGRRSLCRGDVLYTTERQIASSPTRKPLARSPSLPFLSPPSSFLFILPPFLFSLVLSLHASRCHSSFCPVRSSSAFVSLFLIRPLLLFPRPIHPSRSTFPSFSVQPFLRRERVRAFLSPRVSPSSSYGLQLPGRVTAGFRIRASTSSTLSCGTFYQEFQCHVSSSGGRSVGWFGSDCRTNDRFGLFIALSVVWELRRHCRRRLYMYMFSDVKARARMLPQQSVHDDRIV